MANASNHPANKILAEHWEELSRQMVHPTEPVSERLLWKLVANVMEAGRKGITEKNERRLGQEPDRRPREIRRITETLSDGTARKMVVRAVAERRGNAVRFYRQDPYARGLVADFSRFVREWKPSVAGFTAEQMRSPDGNGGHAYSRAQHFIDRAYQRGEALRKAQKG